MWPIPGANVPTGSLKVLRDVGGPGAGTPVHFERHLTLLVLSTVGDSPPHWVRAGEALQRCLLTATVRQLSVQPITQPLEVSSIRTLLTDPEGNDHPQMILRVGYSGPAPATPRRPLQHVLGNAGGPSDAGPLTVPRPTRGS